MIIMGHDEIKFKLSPNLWFFISHLSQKENIRLVFRRDQTYKHLVESLGIPHTEVALIKVNSTPSNLSVISSPGDEVEIYSHFDQEDCERQHITNPKFIVDLHLGKLAIQLRLLGFDVNYGLYTEDADLARCSAEEGRILLTRDRRLLMRSIVKSGYCVRSLNPWDQVLEVVNRYRLRTDFDPFGRCIKCNSPLRTVSKESILDRLEPLTIQYFNEFQECTSCKQIYWKGSHFRAICEGFSSMGEVLKP
jgi:uncharacterized protein